VRIEFAKIQKQLRITNYELREGGRRNETKVERRNFVVELIFNITH